MVSKLFPPVGYAMHSSESKRNPLIARATIPLLPVGKQILSIFTAILLLAIYSSTLSICVTSNFSRRP